MPNSSLLIATVLRELGHEVPDDDKIEMLLQNASDKVMSNEGLDSRKYEYKFVTLEVEWMKGHIEYMSTRPNGPS